MTTQGLRWSQAHKDRLSRIHLDMGRAERASRRCDFCLTVTGSVRSFTLRRAISTPDERSRTRMLSEGSILACRDCWENFGSRCDMCGKGWREVGRLRRYGLQTHVVIGQRKYRNTSTGHLFLCTPCWTRTAKRRTDDEPVIEDDAPEYIAAEEAVSA